LIHPSKKTIIQEISSREVGKSLLIERLTGGDINEVFRLTTANDRFVIKLNDSNRFPGMFIAEKKGLELLAGSNCFKIPVVVAHGELRGTAYLILEYIEEADRPSSFWEAFGQALADLHRTTNSEFGLDHPNYIGSLRQSNKYTQGSAQFYIEQRLEPQFRMARENGFHFKNIEELYKKVEALLPSEPPALLHGDLWSGNYMVGPEGQPVLIDPAVCYGLREMDLAMMQLFGGFPSELFEVYRQLFPLNDGCQERLPLWQLYYLLVHLNLFGAGYLGQVRTIVERYS
jgi:fructosamine-3-kinase